MPSIGTASTNTRQYGFIIADIFGRSLLLFSDDDYEDIARCPTLDAMIMKLNKKFHSINEESKVTLSDIEDKLISELKAEITEFQEQVPFPATYFLDYQKIECFFRKIAKRTKKGFDEEKLSNLGHFNELKNIKYCKNFLDIKNLVLENSGIQKYFEDIRITEDIENINFQKLYFQVLRNFYDRYYEYIRNTSDRHFDEVIKMEMDSFVLDMLLSMPQGSDVSSFIPGCYKKGSLSITKKMILQDNGIDPNSTGEEMVESMTRKRAAVYEESFNLFSGVSSVYCYFKLREHEMKRILYVMEQALNGAGTVGS